MVQLKRDSVPAMQTTIGPFLVPLLTAFRAWVFDIGNITSCIFFVTSAANKVIVGIPMKKLSPANVARLD
jgi:hypothetical protein